MSGAAFVAKMFEPEDLPQDDYLPTVSSVIKFAKLLYAEQVEQRCGVSKGLKFANKEIVHNITSKILAIWTRAGGECFKPPVIYTEKYIREKISKLLEDSKKVETVKVNKDFRERFLTKTPYLFDILSCTQDKCPILSCEQFNCSKLQCNTKVHINCTCDPVKKIPASLLHFIW